MTSVLNGPRYSLTSICDPVVDTLVSYHRGGQEELVGGNLFLRHTIDHSGVNERHLLGMDQDVVF